MQYENYIVICLIPYVSSYHITINATLRDIFEKEISHLLFSLNVQCILYNTVKIKFEKPEFDVPNLYSIKKTSNP